MFQIVVAVLSIALVTVLAVAGFFYLGTAWSGASVKAQVDQFSNSTAQIMGAANLYQTDNGRTMSDAAPGTGVESLIQGNYLASAPALPQAAKAGAKWQITQRGGRPLVSVELDDNDPSTKAICAQAALQGKGCVDDLSTVQ